MKLILILVLLVLDVVHCSAIPWVQKANLGGTGRHRALGIAIGNKGYFGTGHVNGTGVDISYKDWWMFDPASNTWTQKANFPVSVHGAVGFGTNTRGYVGGGSSLTNEFYQYNPVTNTWSPIAPCPFNPGDSQGFTVEGKGYVYLTNQLAEYDPAINQWAIKPQAPVNFGTWSCSFSNGSSGFIKSGTNFYEFKPGQNTWIQRASFPGIMTNGSSAFSINGKGYVTCGYSAGLSNVTDEVWEFDPGSNNWTFIGNFPGTNRRFPIAFALNNKGYFGSGTNGTNFNDFWQFDLTSLSLNESLTEETRIYPNPTNGEFTIQLPSVIDYQFPLTMEIVHTNGTVIEKQVVESSVQHIQLNNRMPFGIYSVNLRKDQEILLTKKILYN